MAQKPNCIGRWLLWRTWQDLRNQRTKRAITEQEYEAEKQAGIGECARPNRGPHQAVDRSSVLPKLAICQQVPHIGCTANLALSRFAPISPGDYHYVRPQGCIRAALTYCRFEEIPDLGRGCEGDRRSAWRRSQGDPQSGSTYRGLSGSSPTTFAPLFRVRFQLSNDGDFSGEKGERDQQTSEHSVLVVQAHEFHCLRMQWRLSRFLSYCNQTEVLLLRSSIHKTGSRCLLIKQSRPPFDF